jgi:hypothetical protein
MLHETSVKELFAQRDVTQPGSKEEDHAVENIISAMFPNTGSYTQDGIPCQL